MSQNTENLESSQLLFKQIKNVDYCPECREDPPNVIEEAASGDLICTSCGIVLEGRLVDGRSEWRTFSGDTGNQKNDPSRVGNAPSLFMFGDELHTKIGPSTGNGQATISLQRTQARTSTHRDNEKLRTGYGQIEAFCSAGSLPGSVVDASKQIFRTAVREKWYVSFKTEIIIAIIYSGCKQAGVARAFKEIDRISGVPRKWHREVSKLARLMNESNMIKNQADSGAEVRFGNDMMNTFGESAATSAKDLMPRYIQALGLPFWS